MPNAITASRKHPGYKIKKDRQWSFRILGKSVISWKIRKDQVTKKSLKKVSKACACNTTCTPCEGLAAPSTPQRHYAV